MNADTWILATRVRSELAELVTVVERAQRLLNKAVERQDEDYYDGVALNLHSFYTGVERIFEDIARALDGSVPQGPEWHRGLLIQMAAEVKTIRPAVIRAQTRRYLDDYRALRHVVRNVYTFNLKASRLQELVTVLPDCYQALNYDIEEFCTFLEATAQSADPD